MPSKPGRDDRMAGSLKLPFYNFGEACAYVFGKRTVDGHAGHVVSRMPEPLEIGFGFAHALEGCRIAGLHVDRSDFPCIVDHRDPEAAVAGLHAGLLDVWEEVGRGWLLAIPFLCQDASRVVFTEGSVGELGVTQFGADRSESFVDLSCPVGAAVLEHELVDGEQSVLAAQEPDHNRPPAGCLPDGLPDVALVDVDLSGLWEVEAFWPSVAIVADEFYYASDSVAASLVLAAVVDVLACHVPEDNCSFEALLQPSHIVNRGAGFVDPLLPLLDLLPPGGRESFASQRALEVLHNSPGHTVDVAVFQRGEVGRIWCRSSESPVPAGRLWHECLQRSQRRQRPAGPLVQPST